MTVYQFTFSNEFKARMLRHLSFWGFYYLYTLIILLPGISYQIFTDTEFYKSATQEALYFLPVYLFSVYFSLYFILPGFLSRKNFMFLVLSICVLLFVSYVTGHLITRFILFSDVNADPQEIQTVSMIKSVGEQLTITGAAISIKTAKYYYLRDEEFKQLSVLRIYHQLDRMKMKLEPAILLGTLKNISLDIEHEGKHAPGMILQLSDMLSYILYETDTSLVPLSKEINLIRDYAGLKKSIFGKHLNVEVSISGDISQHCICPLILLPFLHLSLPYEMHDEPEFIRSEIDIDMRDSLFSFSVKSNLPFPDHHPVSKSMLDNALQNLEIKYPDSFLFSLEEIENGFTLFLELKLIKQSTDDLTKPIQASLHESE